MVAFFNDKLTKDTVSLPMEDRALQFGDGLFETIFIEDNRPRLIKNHIYRLTEGARRMQLALPAAITDPDRLTKRLGELLDLNTIKGKARSKVMIWRKESRQYGYTSYDHQVNYLITVKPMTAISQKDKLTAGICEKVRNYQWHMSAYKKLNALPYIIASAERDNKNLDELIILDVRDHISECISSNIFWIKDQVFYTPALTTGCVAGVMRRFLIEYLKQNNYAIKEGEYNLKDLHSAHSIFTTNSMGIKVISRICEVKYSESDILIKLKKTLTQVNF